MLILRFFLSLGALYGAPSVIHEVTLVQLGSFDLDEPGIYDVPYDYDAKPRKKPKPIQIPAWIMHLNGEKVAVSGYMMPVSLDDNGKMDSFTLVKSVMNCCYGVTPKLHETVSCYMPEGKWVDYYVNIPVRVVGRFKVELQREDGYLVGLYSMDVEKIEKLPASKGPGAGRSGP